MSDDLAGAIARWINPDAQSRHKHSDLPWRAKGMVLPSFAEVWVALKPEIKGLLDNDWTSDGTHLCSKDGKFYVFYSERGIRDSEKVFIDFEAAAREKARQLFDIFCLLHGSKPH